MRILAFISLLVACAHASKFMDLIREEWNTFKIVHNKNYTLNRDGEDEFRMNTFMENRMIIAQHNAKYARGEVSFELELNQFADLTDQEFADNMLGFDSTEVKGVLNTSDSSQGENYFKLDLNVEVPPSFDWRDKGCVTPVKNQLRCGSCYSFSAISAIECQHKLKTGQLVSLSEQNVVDCAQPYGTDGCQGGWMNNVFEYVKANKGIATEAAYPYKGVAEKCHYKSDYMGATVSGFVNIPRGDEVALLQAVATKGTVSIAIDAHASSFRFYKQGVYYEPSCTTDELNHAVVVVGYGTDEHGIDYWLVRNSWGEVFGDKGYIKMARNRNNHCGVTSVASYPFI